MPFEKCKWIGTKTDCVSPIISRSFYGKTGQKGSLLITALGYFEVRINDQPITDWLFLPVVSDYEPRDFSQLLYPLKDKTTNRLYYYRFDVSPYIRDGENTITIQLGNGWYRQSEKAAEGNVSFGKILKTVYKLSVGDIELCSDGSEQWKESEIRYSNLFYGETVDPTCVDGTMHTVDVLSPPATVLTPAMGTPDKVIRTIRPKRIGRYDGKALYDAGENVSGVVEITTSAPAGEKIVLQFAEKLDRENRLDFDSAGGFIVGANGKNQIQENVFVSDGSIRTYQPKFVWQGFRYFTVAGEINSALVKVIHSDAPVTAAFESDSEGLNFLYEAFVRSQLSNMHGSFPSDCPHRERLGYTGDGQVCAPAAMMLLDSREFYRKWIQDILDCQDIHTGHVQHTAPFMGGGGGPGGWGCAIVLVPYAFYRQYGDVEVLKACFDGMVRWITYLTQRLENGRITREEEGGWCLGDWCTLEQTAIPAEYVNTCYFIKCLYILEEIAKQIERTEHVADWQRLRECAKEALIDGYYNAESGSFADGVQGADAYAVWCNLADGALVERIAEKYDALGYFDTGFLGTDILLEVLFAYGYGKTAVRLLEGRKMGSYLYMKHRGATTLWEKWSGDGSWNHPMFGASARHLFSGILGIQQRKGSAGYCDLLIRPYLPENLYYVAGKLQTAKGEISVTLERRGEQVNVSVSAPQEVKMEISIEKVYAIVQ
ncbi:MAG: hypothetical protein E7461_03825 [Ruminococcaceae bacterium]|nr:hypothetical protein [Oscillospiraceae bacterium]